MTIGKGKQICYERSESFRPSTELPSCLCWQGLNQILWACCPKSLIPTWIHNQLSVLIYSTPQNHLHSLLKLQRASKNLKYTIQNLRNSTILASLKYQCSSHPVRFVSNLLFKTFKILHSHLVLQISNLLKAYICWFAAISTIRVPLFKIHMARFMIHFALQLSESFIDSPFPCYLFLCSILEGLFLLVEQLIN